MNVLMIGNGKGSFEVRGKQLGAALGARVALTLEPNDLAWADVVVLVKHAGRAWADRVHNANKPVVWDALDFWRQPEENAADDITALAILKCELALVRPTLIIGATIAMAKACGGVYLPHHAHSGLIPRPVREKVEVVAYEGTKKYLGKWAKAVQQECDRRGWQFVINPPDLSRADIIVALRDGKWDGWMCRNWKSGVKLVNAIAAGRPVISQPSSAWADLNPVGTVVETTEDLKMAMDFWTPADLRDSARTGSEMFDLSWVARDYQALLESVC